MGIHAIDAPEQLLTFNPPDVTPYYFNLHPLNFIIISGIFQSLLLAGLLPFYKKGNQRANTLLGLLILVSSLHFAWYMVMDTNLDQLFLPVFWFPYSYLLTLGPLIYFYTRSLTEIDFTLSIKEIPHLVPVLVEIGLQGYIIWQSVQDGIQYYNAKGFFWIRIVELMAISFSLYCYTRRALFLITHYEQRWREHLSNQKDVTLLWLFRLVKYFRSLWLYWLAFEVAFLLFWKYQLHSIPMFLVLYLLLGIITYSTYWIGIQGLIKGEILLEPHLRFSQPVGEEQSVYSRLSVHDRQTYSQLLEQAMQVEKLYLEPDLTLSTLAGKVNADPNLVSYILNQTLQKSFYDFVNEYRIEEVKKKLSEPGFSHLKLLEIAYQCGFNSKATFNRVFKKITGVSPSVYKKGS
jgi:AraC-like DNA-binding protein